MATARGAYRALLKAQRQLFGGDVEALALAKTQTRAEFMRHSAEQDAATVGRLLDDAMETAQFMRTSIVQGRLNDKGNYEVTPEARHLSTSPVPEHVDDIGEVAQLHALKEARRSPKPSPEPRG